MHSTLFNCINKVSSWRKFMHAFAQPLLHGQDLTQGQFYSWVPFSKTGCRTKAKEPNLPDYLPIAYGRENMPLKDALVLGTNDLSQRHYPKNWWLQKWDHNCNIVLRLNRYDYWPACGLCSVTSNFCLN